MEQNWLFPQNSCNVEQFFTTLEVFSQLNGVDRGMDIQQKLMKAQFEKGLYNPYIEKKDYDLSSANHKIDEPRFYGAIYETPNKKIHVSSYGELLLKYKADIIKRNKVFISMLYNIQFDNPYKKLRGFNIYPLRVVFELLLEKRLENKLSNIEISYILYKLKKLENVEKYNKLIKEILNFRKKNIDEKIEILLINSTQFIKNYVSCKYMLNILRDLEIIEVKNTQNKNFKLQSKVRKKETNIVEKEIKLKKIYLDFVKKLKNEHSVFDSTKKLKSLKSDWIREIYNTVSEVLLQEIGEQDDMYVKFLQIPKLLLESSVDGSKWDIFEEYIMKSFNLFQDVRAERISGAGEPDILCHYLEDNIIFVVDGKSTKKKLGNINDGRLGQHREKYDAKYTIIVTPEYVPSALRDIKKTNTCIITSYCFSDLITKYIFKLFKTKGDCSYGIFNELILKNLGTDISDKIYDIIDRRLGVDKNLV